MNEIIFAVALLIQMQNGVQVGTATGFFYSHDNEIFLVTNRHVVEGEKGVKPDTLRLNLHTNQSDLTQNDFFEVPLSKGKSPLWKVHPKFKNADVALIQLPREKLLKKYVVKSFASSNFLPKGYRLDPGSDILIMGYPFGLHDQKNNLPIFRNGMLASLYGVNIDGNPMFLTDSNLHPGTSGSPVLVKPAQTWTDDQGNTNIVTGISYYLIGIQSATMALNAPNQTPIQLGLGSSWYIDVVDDIAKTF